MKRVTIKDIAKLAGVSYSTVSRALSGSHEISEETRKEVVRLCKEQGYRANSLARSMVRQKTEVLGLIVPDVSNPFYSEICLHLESYARQRGYITMLCNSLYDDSQSEYLFEFLMSHQVDGIIIASSRDSTCQWAGKYIDSMPTVYIGENAGGYAGNFVNTDNRRGGYMAAQYLYGLGHTRVVYFGQRQHSATHLFRAEGFAKAAEELGMEVEYFQNHGESSSIEAGYLLGKDLLARPIEYSAVFSATDSLALGLMQAADEAGIRVPDDISLLGFDNISYVALPQIKLTTIDQPKRLMATSAIDLLLEAIENKDKENFTIKALKPTLVERGSCKRKEARP